MCSRSKFFRPNQNSKQNRGAVFAHKEDSRVFRQLKVSRFPALYAGFLLVFPQLFIDHGWLRFPRFSPITVVLFSRAFADVAVSTGNELLLQVFIVS